MAILTRAVFTFLPLLLSSSLFEFFCVSCVYATAHVYCSVVVHVFNVMFAGLIWLFRCLICLYLEPIQSCTPLLYGNVRTVASTCRNYGWWIQFTRNLFDTWQSVEGTLLQKHSFVIECVKIVIKKKCSDFLWVCMHFCCQDEQAEAFDNEVKVGWGFWLQGKWFWFRY